MTALEFLLLALLLVLVVFAHIPLVIGLIVFCVICALIRISRGERL